MIDGQQHLPEPRDPRVTLSDALMVIGYLVCAAGAWLLHPAVAVLLIGASLLFIGYRRG